jgi:hypothetical protein
MTLRQILLAAAAVSAALWAAIIGVVAAIVWAVA